MSYPNVPTTPTPDAHRRFGSAINHILGQVDWANLTDAADDTAAETAGVEIGELYRNGSVLMVRVA